MFTFLLVYYDLSCQVVWARCSVPPRDAKKSVGISIIHDMSTMTAETDNELKNTHALRTIVIFVLVALLAGHVTVNFQMALGIFCSFHMWGIFWIKLLRDSPNIYSIRIPTTLISDWIPVSIPSTDSMKVRKDRVVSSISELSGIRGCLMMVVLRIMTAIQEMILLLAIQQDLHHRDTYLFNIQSGNDMVPIFMLIMTIGQFLTGHFELNKMDSFHESGHYMGVFGIFLGSLMIGFVLHWNMISLILIALQFGTVFYWITYLAKCEMKSKDIRVVTRNSKMCIGIELVIFYITNIILVITVYSSGENEGNMFASPFKRK